MSKEDKCQCGDKKQGSIYRGDPMTGWYLECPLCHKHQYFGMLLEGEIEQTAPQGEK